MVKPKPMKFKATNEKQELKKHIDAIAPHLTDIQKWDQVVEKALSPPDTSALEKQIRELEITNESLKKELEDRTIEVESTMIDHIVKENKAKVAELEAENESLRKLLALNAESHPDRCESVAHYDKIWNEEMRGNGMTKFYEEVGRLINDYEWTLKDCDKLKAENESLKQELETANLRAKSFQALDEVERAELKDAKQTIVVQNQLIAVLRMIFMSRHVVVGPKEREEMLLQANDGYRQSNEEFIAKMLKVVEFVNKFQEDPRVERHYQNLLEGRKDLDKHKVPLPILFTEALDYATCVDEMRANINGLFVMPVNQDPKANKMEKEEIENQIIRSIRLSPEEFRQKMLKDTAGLKEFLKTQDKTQPAHANALEDAMRLEKIIQETPSKDTIESSKLDKQD